MIQLSLAEARTIAVVAQRLHGTGIGSPSSESVLQSLGCIQLDTINVVRRSHELVLLARSVADSQARDILNPPAPVAFEYWAHAASLVPLSSWPLLGFRRRSLLAHGWRGPAVDPAACRYVRNVVADMGEVTITDLGGACGSGWERSAPAKWAAEWLLATGELACLKRQGWKRVYQDSSTLPADLRNVNLSDADCISGLAEIAVSALGVATADDIADYFRLPATAIASYLASQEKLEPAAIEGWSQRAWVLPGALPLSVPDEHLCTPLSPFDSLVWHRPRARRLFGIEYTLEAYKTAANRECGYFGMPVLAGTQIVGRIAVRSSHGITRLEGFQLREGHDAGHLHTALHTAAVWAGSHTIEANPLCSPHCQLTDSR